MNEIRGPGCSISGTLNITRKRATLAKTYPEFTTAECQKHVVKHGCGPDLCCARTAGSGEACQIHKSNKRTQQKR